MPSAPVKTVISLSKLFPTPDPPLGDFCNEILCAFTNNAALALRFPNLL